MSTTVVNGAPMTYFYGTDDQSTRQIQREPEARPTHLPMIWTYAKKGREDVYFVVGGSRSVLFGEETFDIRSKYATHATVLANTVNAAGNLCAIRRVRPHDANGPATLRLWMDVLVKEIPEYERNSDGTYRYDSFGRLIETGNTIPGGHQVKFVVTQATGQFGEATMGVGDQVDPVTNTQSDRYPIMDFEVDSFGAYGNNIGVKIWAATSNSYSPLDERLVSNQKVYPFRIAAVERKDSLSTGKQVATQLGEQYLDVVLKPDMVNPYNDRDVSVGEVFIPAYQDFRTLGTPPQFGPFGRMKVYDDYIETLIEQFYQAERPYIDSFSDFWDEADEAYRFNIFGGVSTQGVPYQSYVFNNEDPNSSVLTEHSVLYASGGSDGTMNEALFAELVAEDVRNFADRNHHYQNTARYPVSHFYDSGFPLDTKYALCSALAIRKDTVVVLSTYDVLGVPLSAADESSLAIALKTRLQMYPESEYFGTSTMRGMVVPRFGKMINNQYRKKLPLSIEVAMKSARYMGASNKIWDSVYNFEGDPNNRVVSFTDINSTWTPAHVRNKDWDNGLVAVLDYDRSEAFFPAYKTVYDNDTSVLNSYITVCAIAELQKIGEEVWKELSGRSDLTESQLVKEVEDRYNAKTTHLFDSRYVITPRAYFTADDRSRGYSWTTEVTIYSPTMYTVQKLIVVARRISDLEGEQ